MAIGGLATDGTAGTHPPRWGAVTSTETTIAPPNPRRKPRVLIGDPPFTGTEARGASPSVTSTD